MRGWLRAAFVDNAAIKFVSLVLAVTIFILVNSSEDVDMGVNVPVLYIESEDRALVSERVDQVRLSIRGSWRRTKRFHDGEIQPIKIDLTKRTDGLLVFQEDMIDMPHGLELRSIAPQSAPLRFEPKISRSVPIAARTAGRPAAGFHLVEAKVLQPMVTVRGAKSIVDATERIETIEIVIDGREQTYTTTASLATPVGLEMAKVVPVKVIIAPDESERVLEQVAVAVRPLLGAGDLGASFAVVPASIQVTLHGTLEEIDRAIAAGVEAYVKVSPDDPGGRPVEVLVRALDVGHEVVPREVTVVRKSRP